MSAEPRIIAKFSDTAGLKDAIRTRISELAISLDVVDEICNFPLRYASKLLAPSDMKNLGPMSFESLIGELGVELFMVENPLTRERMLRRIEYATTGRPRKPVDLALGKTRHFIFKVSLRQLKKYAKMGGQARARLPPARLRQIARKAARTRRMRAALKEAIARKKLEIG